jgi:hypothetical protein
VPTNSDCTLRDAIAAASSGSDTINFNSSGLGTIILTNGTLTLNASVAIAGPDAALVAIDGGCLGCDAGGTPTGGATAILVTTGINVRLSGITIQHGNASISGGGDSGEGVSAIYGGGIFNNAGNLTIANSVLRNNVNMHSNSTDGIWGAGGAIFTHGGLVNVISSTISGNRVPAGIGAGMAIRSGATVTVTNSTLVDNQGGESSEGGGAIYNYNSTLSVINSTITGNAIANPTGRGYGGGGIYNYSFQFPGIFTLINSIVAGNTASHGAPDIAGGVNTSSHNLLSSAVGTHDQIVNGVNGDIVNPIPLLGTLGAYGGPTQTVPLLPGSPAIGAGVTGPNIPTFDQRGVARTGHTDIGAFQSQGFSLTRTSGDNQSTDTGTDFANLFVVTVTSNAS